jgi:hypothetical protein
MAVLNRGVQIIWNNESTGEYGTTGPTGSTGPAPGSSSYAVVGAQTNVAVHVEVDGATTIRVEAAYSANRAAGRNYDPGDSDAHPYYSIYSSDSYLATGFAPSDAQAVMVRRPLEFVFESAGKAAFDISPYTPNFLRLTSSNDVTATAAVEVVG